MASDCELFIGFVPYEADEEELKSFLNGLCSDKTGSVRHVLIKRDLTTRESRGFAFVKMANMKAGNEIVKSGPHSFKGNTLEISISAKTRSTNRYISGRSTSTSTGGLPYDSTSNANGGGKISDSSNPQIGCVGLMLDADRIQTEPDFSNPIIVYLNENDKSSGRFMKGDRVYLEWKWLDDLNIFETSFVAELEEGFTKVTVYGLKANYGYLDRRSQNKPNVFFTNTLVERAVGFSCKVGTLLRAGDELHHMSWDQRLKDRTLVNMKAERLRIPDMVVRREGKFSRFGILIEISGDKVQGILYCAPLGKVLIENMSRVSNPSNIGWQYGDRIVFDEQKLADGSFFDCDYVALNPHCDQNVRMANIDYALEMADRNSKIEAAQHDHDIVKPTKIETPVPNFDYESSTSAMSSAGEVDTPTTRFASVPPMNSVNELSPAALPTISDQDRILSRGSRGFGTNSTRLGFDAPSSSMGPATSVNRTAVNRGFGANSLQGHYSNEQLSLEAALNEMMLESDVSASQSSEVGVQTDKQPLVHSDFVRAMLDDEEIFPLIARKHPQKLRQLFLGRDGSQ